MDGLLFREDFMRTFLIGMVVAAAAAVLGVGAAYGGNAVLKTYRVQNAEPVRIISESGEDCVIRELPGGVRPFGGMREWMRDRQELFRDLRSESGNPKR